MDSEGDQILSSIVPKSPGHIVAPTQFMLAGEAEDFMEWEDWDGLPPDNDVVVDESDAIEGLAWTVDPSCWLLVFRAYPEKEGHWIKLDSEIYVDSRGQHYQVPLGKLWGKDTRPPSGKALASINQAWGRRYPDGDKNPYQLYPVWVWASPFQLDWSRLPPLHGDDHTCERGVFDRWASRRGLEHTTTTLDQLSASPMAVLVESVWQEAFALNRAFVNALASARPTPSERDKHLLYSMVRELVDQNPMLLGHLNSKAFFQFDSDVAIRERETYEKVSKAVSELLAFLKTSRFQTFLEDFEFTHDGSAWKKRLILLSRAYRRTMNVPAAAPEIERAAPSIRKELGKQQYDSTQSFKDFRKVAKSYLYLAKAFLEPADFAKGIPGWLEKPIIRFIEKWYGLPLRAVDTTVDGKVVRLWDKDNVAAIKSKSSLGPLHLGFFLFLEEANVLYQLYTLADAKDLPDTWKRSLNLTGAVCSLSAQAVDVTYAWAKAQLAAQKTSAKTVIVGPVKDAGGLKAAVIKNAVNRELTIPLKAGVNAVGSATEAVTGVMSVYEDRASGDSRAAKYHIAQAAGGMVSLIGYALMFSGPLTPLGAVLVFAGSATGTVGSIGGALSKTTDLEKWLMYCAWGKKVGNTDYGAQEFSWAGGRPQDLGYMVKRQICTLNNLLVCRVESNVVFDGAGQPHIEIVVHPTMLSDAGCIHLEVAIDGVVRRPLSPWKTGEDRRDAEGCFRERYRLDISRRREGNCTVRLHMKPFGNEVWYPAKPRAETFQYQVSWLHGAPQQGSSVT